MHRHPNTPAGPVDWLTVDGPSLAGNLLGEPTRRDVAVWRPPGQDGAGLPLLVALAGYAGSGRAMASFRAFGENLPERLDRLSAEGRLPPVVVAMPDAYTRLGGNQYVDSPILGRWSGFLADDLLPFLEARYGCGGAGRRGLFGKSSGGYGALINALARPGTWSAVACHSGDLGFDWVYRPELPTALRCLAPYDGDVANFRTRLAEKEQASSEEVTTLMMLAMAASYDPDPPAWPDIPLPLDRLTGRLDPERWARWRAADPLAIADEGPGPWTEALAGLKALIIDCGTRDEYNILYGSRRFAAALTAEGIAHRFEEFPGTHSGTAHRMDSSLPMLAAALTDVSVPG